MIQSISINGLRGIAKGEIEGFAPLTILVGPNSSGKSTILDACMLAASANTENAIKRCVLRRYGVNRPGRWLLTRPFQSSEHSIGIRVSRQPRLIRMRYVDDEENDWVNIDVTSRNAIVLKGKALFSATSFKSFRGPNRTADPELQNRGTVSQIGLVDSRVLGSPKSLAELYSASVEAGNLGNVLNLAKEIVPGVRDIRLLMEGGDAVVHLELENSSLPVGVLGDGVQMLFRLAFEMAVVSTGVVLLEEPEVHQHPRVIRQSAKIIAAAVQRNVQVILTTHSLELIDALLGEAKDRDLLDQLAVFRTNLTEGQLATSRISGADAAFSRQQIEDDLR
jgi:energy-coupling factor transporter ATP-binding protein EcfA2